MLVVLSAFLFSKVGLITMVIKYEIAMATFNGQEYLDEQIASLLSQTIKPHRIVIFDDNSSDNVGKFLNIGEMSLPSRLS